MKVLKRGSYRPALIEDTWTCDCGRVRTVKYYENDTKEVSCNTCGAECGFGERAGF